MKKAIKITTIILVIFAVVTQVVTIFISNNASTDSIKATELSSAIEKLTEENINLESEVLTYASYQAVASRAAELGYQKTREFVSVYDPVKLALLR